MENGSNQQQIASPNLFASDLFAQPRLEILKWLLIDAAHHCQSARELVKLSRSPFLRFKQNENPKDQGILFNKNMIREVQEHARHALTAKLGSSKRLANKFKTLDIHKINDNAGVYASTWLMNVAEKLDVDLVDVVLTLGADPNIQERGGYTAAHYALWSRKHPQGYDNIPDQDDKRNAILNLLRLYGANFGIYSTLHNTPKQSPFLHIIGHYYDQSSKILDVLLREQPELVKQLHGSELKGGNSGIVVLRREIKNLNPSLNTVAFLINHGVLFSHEYLTNALWVPPAACLKLLISGGLDVFSMCRNGGSLLHSCIRDYWFSIGPTCTAIRKKNLDKISLLVIHDVARVPDKQGNKANDFLKQTAQNQNQQAVHEIYHTWQEAADELKAICAETVAVLGEHRAPTLGHILLALSKQAIPTDPQLKERRKQLIIRLVGHGANCTLVDNQGNTAAMNAAKGDTEVYELLKNHLRSNILYDKQGRTAAQIFKEKQDVEKEMSAAQIMVTMVETNNNNSNNNNVHEDELPLERQSKRHKIGN